MGLRQYLAAGAVLAPLAAFSAAAIPSAERIAFEIRRDGAAIGSHDIVFERHGDALHVAIDIEIEIRFAFITLFRYRHRNREVWRDGRLVALDSTTDDDGRRHRVRVRATAAGLRVEGTDGSFLAPPDTLPTSYWNPETVARDRLLDTQHGRMVDIRITPAGQEPVTIDGAAVPSRKYRMSGDLELELWYTPEGRLASIAFEARGATVRYAAL